MSTAIGDLVVRFGAQTQGFDRGRRRVQGGLRGLSNTVSGLIRSFAPLSGGLLLAGLAREGEQFNRKMRGSLAIMGNVPAEVEKQMRKTAFNVARDTKFGAGEAAEAYYFLASAGMNAQQQIAAMPQVAKFAQAGNFNLATATDLATDAQAALGLTSKNSAQNLLNLTRVTDVLTKANTLANASSEQFSKALTNKAGAAMRTVGMEIEEGVAVLAAWADQGLKGEEAGTAFNIVLRDLQSKAIQNAQAFKEMNIAVYEAGELRNLSDIVADLEKRLEGMTDQGKKATLMQLGFADKSMIFLQTLIGTSQKIAAYEHHLEKAGGTTAEVADKQLTPLQKGFAKLSSSAVQASSSFMNDFGPMLGDMASGMAELFTMTNALGGGLASMFEDVDENRGPGYFTKLGRGIHVLGLQLAELAAKGGLSAAIGGGDWEDAALQVRGVRNEMKRLQEEWGQRDTPIVGASSRAIERLMVHARKGNEEAQGILREKGLDWETATNDALQLTSVIARAEEQLEKLGKTAGRVSDSEALEKFLEPLRNAGVNMSTLEEMARRFQERLEQTKVADLEDTLQKQVDNWRLELANLGMSSRQSAIQDMAGQIGGRGPAETERLAKQYLDPMIEMLNQFNTKEAGQKFHQMTQDMQEQLFQLRSGASAATMAIRQFARQPGATSEQIAKLEQLAEMMEQAGKAQEAQDEIDDTSHRPRHAAAAGFQTQKAYSMILAATGQKDRTQDEIAKASKENVEESKVHTALLGEIASGQSVEFIDLPT